MIEPRITELEEHDGCVPDNVYPASHRSSHDSPFPRTEPAAQLEPTDPFAGTLMLEKSLHSPLETVLHTTSPVANVPAEHDGWLPDNAKDALSHDKSHDVPCSRTLPGEHAAGRLAPFSGFVKSLGTVQLSGSQEIQPGSNAPAWHDGCCPIAE